jgi:hypothetical protein
LVEELPKAAVRWDLVPSIVALFKGKDLLIIAHIHLKYFLSYRHRYYLCDSVGEDSEAAKPTVQKKLFNKNEEHCGAL